MRYLVALFVAVALAAPSTASAGPLLDGSIAAANAFWGGDPCEAEGGIRVQFQKLAANPEGETLAASFVVPDRPCLVTLNTNYVWSTMPHELCNVMTHEVGHVRAWMLTHDADKAGHHDETGIMAAVITVSTPQCDAFARKLRQQLERAQTRAMSADRHRR